MGPGKDRTGTIVHDSARQGKRGGLRSSAISKQLSAVSKQNPSNHHHSFEAVML
jgi:hypothetical protein